MSRLLLLPSGKSITGFTFPAVASRKVGARKTRVAAAVFSFHSSSTSAMRLPYTPNPPTTADADEQAIVTRIQARRAPRPLQPLDLTLLHAPAVADGWNSFLGAVRTRTGLGADLRELAICRVAVVNEAWYEWGHHAPLAVQGGVSEAAMTSIARHPNLDAVTAEDRAAVGLDDRCFLSLCYADEMTRNVKVRDETFAELKKHFTDREIVELTATVAAYNCVSRFLVALDVGERNGTGPDGGH